MKKKKQLLREIKEAQEQIEEGKREIEDNESKILSLKQRETKTIALLKHIKGSIKRNLKFLQSQKDSYSHGLNKDSKVSEHGNTIK